MATASQSDLSALETAIRDFKTKYAALSSNTFGANIARTGDNALMQEYGDTLARMTSINNLIDRTLNMWQSFKSAIGLSGLGALPLIPIAVVTALTVAIASAVKINDNFMQKAAVKIIMQQNPALSYTDAVSEYQKSTQGFFGKGIDLMQTAMVLGVAFFAFMIFGRR